MKAYQDPAHPGNDPQHHTGKECIERGCMRPAGTWWSPLWCFECNVERMDRMAKPVKDGETGGRSRPRDKDFRTFIVPLAGDFWRVTVTRLSDGMTMTQRAYGEWTAAERVAMTLQGALTPPDAPLPVAEFECWTCKARTEETGRPWPWQLDEYAANQHRKAYHDIRPAGGKRP